MAQVSSASLYYPFGWEMPGRKFVSGEEYRFGFNGQEEDPDMGVVFKYRVHDARVGRFLSVDPLAPDYPWNSCYAFAENSTILFIDLEGLERALSGASLRTAATRLEKMNFGALKDNVPNDNSYFTKIKGATENEAITLRYGSDKPSEVMSNIVYSTENGGSFSADCSAFTQIVFLEAARIELGDRGFDFSFSNGAKKKKNRFYDPLIIDYVYSTNVNHQRLYERSTDSDEDGIVFKDWQGTFTNYDTEQEFIDQLPVGSLITFMANSMAEIDAGALGNFRYENVLKVGEDSYAAHPFGIVSYSTLINKLNELTPSGHRLHAVDQLMYEDTP
nr:RHS repeat-associated core domain-containing protein [Saprospira grandis]